MSREAFNPETYRQEIVKLYSSMPPELLFGERMFINASYIAQKAEGDLPQEKEEAFQIRMDVLTELITGK